MPVEAGVTWGSDWTNSRANRVDLEPGKTEYSVTIPTGLTGVVAARIIVKANGLTNKWPRWDEDPRGQVVIPE